MAFTRQSTGTSTSFSRDGVLTETITTPPFQVFNITDTKNYSLGHNWSIGIDTSVNSLSFKYSNKSILTLDSSGFTMSSIVLPPQSSYPSNPASGTLYNLNNEMFIYT
jgi:hypothetical protein